MFETEKYRNRVLLAPQATGVESGGYFSPTPGVQFITIRVIAGMGYATDLTMSLNSADDASGTNPVAFADVPIYVNGVRQAVNGHSYTITADTGNFIVDFCILPAQIPEGKTIGLAYEASNAGNLIAAEVIEDTAYKPMEA